MNKLNPIEKAYWTKVYVMFGTDYEAWDKDRSTFHDEYISLVRDSSIARLSDLKANKINVYDIDQKRFTDEFIKLILED